MKWTDIPHGTITAAEQRLWVALGDDAAKVVKCINTNPEYLAELVAFAVTKIPKPVWKSGGVGPWSLFS